MHSAPPTPPTPSPAVVSSPRTTAAAVASLAAFYTGIAVWLTWPQAIHLATRTAAHHDSLFSMWRLAWIAHALRAAPAHLFDGNIFFPNVRTLAYSDAILLPGVALAPASWLGVPIAVTYNVLMLGSFVLSALAAAWLAWRVTRRFEAAAVAGLVYGFAPLRFEHFAHLELQLNWWLPLLLVAIEAAVRHGGWRAWLTVSLLATAQLLCCIYHTMLFAVYGAVFAALSAWPVLERPRRWAGAAWLAVPAVVMAAYSIPYRANHAQLGDRSWAEVMSYSAEWIDVLRTAPSSVTWGERLAGGHTERFLFIGGMALVLAALAVLDAVIRRQHRRIVLTHLLLAAVAIDLARGGHGFLFPWLVAHAPGFTGLRVPARAGILLLLSASVLAAIGVTALTARLRTVTALALVAGIIGVTGWEYRQRLDFRTLDGVSPVYDVIRSYGRPIVVLELPVTTPDRLDIIPDPTYMYNSTHRWLTLANGYSGFYPGDYLHLLDNLRHFPMSGGSLRYVQRRRITHLVLHEKNWRGPVSFGDTVVRLIEAGWTPLVQQGAIGDNAVLFVVPAP